VPQDKPEVKAEPGFEDEVVAFNLFAYLSRSDVTWNPSIVSVCKASLYCPTTEEYILPVIHGNDRVEWFVQLSDEIQWEVEDRDTGAVRARVTMRLATSRPCPPTFATAGSRRSADAARLEALRRAARARERQDAPRPCSSDAEPGGEYDTVTKRRSTSRSFSARADHHSLAGRHYRGGGHDWARRVVPAHRPCLRRGKFDRYSSAPELSPIHIRDDGPTIRHAEREHSRSPAVFMGAVPRIGLGATFSISHRHPFYAARLWATLDHLTRGRARGTW
jgi:hypothetical protein